MAKRKKKVRTSRFPTFLITVGLVLVSLWGAHRYLYNRSLSLSDAFLASYTRTHTQVAFPIHITVGDKIRLQVVEAVKVSSSWPVSPTAANHVLASALPGEAGNVVIYGHNLNTIFGYLVGAQVGDQVDIRTNDGKRHVYKITETHIVDPSQTALLSPTTTEVLTLYTCTGLLDSQRFVARAEPIK